MNLRESQSHPKKHLGVNHHNHKGSWLFLAINHQNLYLIAYDVSDRQLRLAGFLGSAAMEICRYFRGETDVV